MADFLTKRELIARLKISPMTLSRWMRARVIPFHRVGRIVRFREEEVIEALNRYRLASVGENANRKMRPANDRAPSVKNQ